LPPATGILISHHVFTDTSPNISVRMFMTCHPATHQKFMQLSYLYAMAVPEIACVLKQAMTAPFRPVVYRALGSIVSLQSESGEVPRDAFVGKQVSDVEMSGGARIVPGQNVRPQIGRVSPGEALFADPPGQAHDHGSATGSGNVAQPHRALPGIRHEVLVVVLVHEPIAQDRQEPE
jgi:hypothetical protein